MSDMSDSDSEASELNSDIDTNLSDTTSQECNDGVKIDTTYHDITAQAGQNDLSPYRVEVGDLHLESEEHATGNAASAKARPT